MRLALQNLKMQRNQYISFGIMLCITAFIVNIALVLAFQTSKAYDKKFEELNTADLNILIPFVQDYENLLEEIGTIEGVILAERHEGLFSTTTVHDFAETDFDMNTVFYNLGEDRTLNLIEVVNDIKQSWNVIYVPDYMTKLGGFSIGDEITYFIGESNYSFLIDGTVAEMQYGNYGTGLIGAYLPEKAYELFATENSTQLITEYSIQIGTDAELNTIKNKVASLFSEKGIILLSINDHVTAKQTRFMISNLLIAIFIALAFIIFLINIFLSNFRILNNIENEMTNMGVLKAIGYTSLNIITSEIVPYTLVGILSTISGAIISYTALPLVSNFLATQSGFSFTPTFDLYAMFMTTFVTTVLTVICTYFCAKKIRILEPIDAIRGITCNSSYKNHFPLASSKVSVKFALVLKQIASSTGQNILLFILSFGIMILLSFAGTLLYNINIKPDNFMNTISEESPSVIFTATDSGGLHQLKTSLQNDNRVNSVLEYATVPVSYVDGSMICFVCEDFSLVTNDICYEGRNPTGNDEIAIGNALADQYNIGSTIEIKNGSNYCNYTITGFIQSINNNGIICELTKNGYEKISEDIPNSLNVYLTGEPANVFIAECETEFSELLAASVNYEQLAENGRKIYSRVVSAVCIAVFLISVLVILLVMYIIINSMITLRRREFGIYKAIGWANRQLVFQSIFSFVPIIAISAFFSALVGLSLIPAINNVIWEMLGAMKNHFEVSLCFLLAFALILISISFIISLILARPIKHITAYSLFNE